jgi:ATP-dependent RNA helicase DeaD
MEPLVSPAPGADGPEPVPPANTTDPRTPCPPHLAPSEPHDAEPIDTGELVAELDAAEEEAVKDPEHESAPPPETDPAMVFTDLKLIRPLQEAIDRAGYVHPTPVQEAVIPLAMKGKDVIGQAQTGTGKTAAFLIPFMNRWRPHRLKGPIGLVMTPTRELALQIAVESQKLAPSRRFRTVAVYGGARMGKQLDGLAAGCDLVVGTPGRMLDHLRRGSMKLGDVRYVVLDEADRMLDIGFRPDIERILRQCPLQRQTLLMSATVPDPIKRLVNRYMTDPTHLHMTPETPTVDKIRQRYFTVDQEKKFSLLREVIEREQPRQCLIFVERKKWADNLYRDLKRAVPNAAVIHGDLPQSLRERIMAAFRVGQIKYLIATDVMSRGIDVSDISHVINYDLPQDIESYVHRIGRTGRIGKDGIAISFVTPEQSGQLTDIEMMINKLIEEDKLPGDWFTPRRVSSRRDEPGDLVEVSRTVADIRDDSGWGLDENEDFTTKLGTAAGEQPASVDQPAEKKTTFGKRGKRYSNRL